MKLSLKYRCARAFAFDGKHGERLTRNSLFTRTFSLMEGKRDP